MIGGRAGSDKSKVTGDSVEHALQGGTTETVLPYRSTPKVSVYMGAWVIRISKFGRLVWRSDAWAYNCGRMYVNSFFHIRRVIMVIIVIVHTGERMGTHARGERCDRLCHHAVPIPRSLTRVEAMHGSREVRYYRV